jgi:3-keto-5-aminohexanoate cleavage enzyme
MNQDHPNNGTNQRDLRKIIITVAPVCHSGKAVPSECRNPLTPPEIAEEVTNCTLAGASMVHLHMRDENGVLTSDPAIFTRTLEMIATHSDIIIQGSTGGLSSLSLDERCACLEIPLVEVASLNMGSVNFGESVYINTLPDIRYWAGKMKAKRVLPEPELFDLSMVETCNRLACEGVLERPLHYNFCLGNAGALSATPRNLSCMVSLMEPGSEWGLNHDRMPGFSMLACALAMGASVVRVGFEDSFYEAPGKTAETNALLVEKLASLIRQMGMEPATPAEAREMLGLVKLRPERQLR